MTTCVRCQPPCRPIETLHDGVITIFHGYGNGCTFADSCDCTSFTLYETTEAALDAWLQHERAGQLYYRIHVRGRGHLLTNVVVDA